MDINVEKLAERLAQRLFITQNLRDIEMAKIQYGISLILGVIIEFTVVYAISLILGFGFYTVVIMLSALFLRINTGGAHCSTYNRCVAFTAIYFLPFSALTKFINLYFSLKVEFITSILLYFIVFAIVREYKFYKIVISISVILDTLLFFIGAAFGVKIFFIISISFILQSIMITPLGGMIVSRADSILKKLKI
ncbi:MAG TPA: accessory regulator AgrB [Clostridia bacterium]|nr:accessory regulator AgrB [Clostridia bacterium]